MHWMFLPLKRYADFTGRSRRMEYWMFSLGLAIAVFLFICAMFVSFDFRGNTEDMGFPAIVILFFGLGIVGWLAIIVPSFAVSVRRFHDQDLSGWWILMPLAPYALGFAIMLGSLAGGMPGLTIVGGLAFLVGVICAIVLLVWYCSAGTNGPNRFGPDPKGVSTEQLAETFE